MNLCSFLERRRATTNSSSNGEYEVRILRNANGGADAYEIYNSQGKFVRRYTTQAEADQAAANWNAASDPLTAPPREGAYPPLDPKRYRQSKSSSIFSEKTPDGSYVYALDENNLLHVALEGSHMHPKVLGDGKRANGAGGLIVKNGEVVEIDNMSGTFRPYPGTLADVEQAVTRQGGKVSSKVNRTTLKPEDW